MEALFQPASSSNEAVIFGAACTLATSLDIVAWNHYSQVLAPLILTSTSRFVAEASPGLDGEDSAYQSARPFVNALSLLARLAFSGRLRAIVDMASPAVKSWERVIGEKCKSILEEWGRRYKGGDVPNEDEVGCGYRRGLLRSERGANVHALHQTHVLLDVLLIVPQLPSYRTAVLSLVAELAGALADTPSDVARAAFLESAASPAQVLGASLLAFSRIDEALKGSDNATALRLAEHVLPMIEGFAWHRSVMQGVAALGLAKKASDLSSDTQTRIYDAILPNLLSEDSLLRLSSLQIAATLFPGSSAPVAADMIVKCIEVEEMPLTVMGAREKSMKVRKIGLVAHGQLGRDGEEIKPALDIVLRYLTGRSW